MVKSLKLDIFHGTLGEILSNHFPDYGIGEYFNSDYSSVSWLSVIDRDTQFKVAEAIAVEKFTSRDDTPVLLIIDYVNSDSRRYTDIEQALSFMQIILKMASDRKAANKKSASNEKQEEENTVNLESLRDLFGLNIKDVIFNDPATVVLWEDGEKTIVQCQNGEPFDPEKGLAIAISKKIYGNKHAYYEVFKKWVGRYNKKKSKAAENDPVEFISNGHRYGRDDIIQDTEVIRPYCDINKPEDNNETNE